MELLVNKFNQSKKKPHPTFGMDRTLEESKALLAAIDQAEAKTDNSKTELYFKTKRSY